MTYRTWRWCPFSILPLPTCRYNCLPIGQRVGRLVRVMRNYDMRLVLPAKFRFGRWLQSAACQRHQSVGKSASRREYLLVRVHRMDHQGAGSCFTSSLKSERFSLWDFHGHLRCLPFSFSSVVGPGAAIREPRTRGKATDGPPTRAMGPLMGTSARFQVHLRWRDNVLPGCGYPAGGSGYPPVGATRRCYDHAVLQPDGPSDAFHKPDWLTVVSLNVLVQDNSLLAHPANAAD